MIEMHVTDVSVGSNVSTGKIDIALSGTTQLLTLNADDLVAEMDVETARTLRDMLTDCIDHQDAGGHDV